ncbi:hypothetical protein, partial [uncultured Duncaniella sp.]
MTEQEKKIIKNEILDQLTLDSKLIEQLVPEIQLSDEDLFEINGGRHVSFKTMRKYGFDFEKIAELFLSRKDNDTAAGLITFLKGLVSDAIARLKGGAEFGEFVSG